MWQRPLTSSVSHRMPVCIHCGGEIEFHTDLYSGQRIPRHLFGCCTQDSGEGKQSEARRPENYLWGTRESYAAPSKCPKCGCALFFIRHNGGGVWLDELGWPWPKHGCFVKTPEPSWASFLREKHSPLLRPNPSLTASKSTQQNPPNRYFVGVVVEARLFKRDSTTYTGLAIEGPKSRKCVAVAHDRAPDTYRDCIVVINLSKSTLASTNHRYTELLKLPVTPPDLGLPEGWSSQRSGG